MLNTKVLLAVLFLVGMGSIIPHLAYGQEADLKSSPGYADWQAAIELAAKGRVIEAEESLKRAIRSDENLDQAKTHLASLYLQQGRFKESIATYKQVVVRRPKDAAAHHQLGIAYYRFGDTLKATESLRVAAKLAPNSKTILKDLGTLLLQANNIMEASSLFGEIVRRFPDEADAHNDYGVVLTKVGKVPAAVESFRKAIEINSNHVDARYNLGVAYLDNWQLSRAAAEFEQAIAMQPKYADAHFNLGRVRFRLGEFDQAEQSFLAVTKINNAYTEAHYYLGRVSLKKDNPKQAVARFTEALRHNPNHGASKLEMGAVMYRLRRFPVAISQFNSLLQNDPDNADAHYLLAKCLTAMNRPADALPHFREAIWLRSDWPMAKNDFAWLLATTADENVRDGELSKKVSEAAVKQAEDSIPIILDTLASAYAETGDFDMAVETLQKAIDAAKSRGNQDAVEKMEKRLELYQAGQPYRDE